MLRLFSNLAVVVAVTCTIAPLASAQDDAATKERLKRQNRSTVDDSSYSQRADRETSGQAVRASELIGMNIANSRDESVGEINDIVMDTKTGRVRYLAVTYGGFLGVGDKMFAVPYDAFKVKQSANDSGTDGDFVLVLDVTQKQLEGAEGFDQDHWPNFADRKFTRELDTRYGVNRGNIRDRLREGRVNVDANRDGVDVGVDVDDRE